MSDILQKLRQDNTLSQAFSQMVITKNEAINKSSIYIYCANIMYNGDIAFFPVIGREKSADYIDLINKKNYELWYGESKSKINRNFKRHEAATDVSHGIKLVGISHETLNRLLSSSKILIDRAITLVKDEVDRQYLTKEKYQKNEFHRMFSQINYLPELEVQKNMDWSIDSSDGITTAERKDLDHAWAYEADSVDYADPYDLNDDGIVDWSDIDGDGVPDYQQ